MCFFKFISLSLIQRQGDPKAQKSIPISSRLSLQPMSHSDQDSLVDSFSQGDGISPGFRISNYDSDNLAGTSNSKIQNLFVQNKNVSNSSSKVEVESDLLSPQRSHNHVVPMHAESKNDDALTDVAQYDIFSNTAHVELSEDQPNNVKRVDSKSSGLEIVSDEENALKLDTEHDEPDFDTVSGMLNQQGAESSHNDYLNKTENETARISEISKITVKKQERKTRRKRSTIVDANDDDTDLVKPYNAEIMHSIIQDPFPPPLFLLPALTLHSMLAENKQRGLANHLLGNRFFPDLRVRYHKDIHFFNLLLLALERFWVRDYRAAASLMPLLFCDIFGPRASQPELMFAREITFLATEILRLDRSEVGLENLESFLRKTIFRELQRGERLLFFNRLSKVMALKELFVELCNQGRVEEALEELELCILHEPFKNDPVLHFFQGIACFKIASDCSAEGHTSRTNSSGIEGNTNHVNSITLLMNAEKSFIVALELDPKTPLYMHYISLVRLANHDIEGALTNCQTWCAEHPDNVSGLQSLLEILGKIKKLQKHQAESHHGLIRRPSFHEEQLNEEILRTAQRLIRLDPFSEDSLHVIRKAVSKRKKVVHVDDEAMGVDIDLIECYASRIDTGMGTYEAWHKLRKALQKKHDGERVKEQVWLKSGRWEWWPTHFFRAACGRADYKTDPKLAREKCKVLDLLYDRETLYSFEVKANQRKDTKAVSSGRVASDRYDQNEEEEEEEMKIDAIQSMEIDEAGKHQEDGNNFDEEEEEEEEEELDIEAIQSMEMNETGKHQEDGNNFNEEEEEEEGEELDIEAIQRMEMDEMDEIGKGQEDANDFDKEE